MFALFLLPAANVRAAEVPVSVLQEQDNQMSNKIRNSGRNGADYVLTLSDGGESTTVSGTKIPK